MSIIISHLRLKPIKLMVEITLNVPISRSADVNISMLDEREVDGHWWCGNKQRPPKENKQSYLFRACYSERPARTQRQAGQRERVTVGERKGFSLTAGCWHRGAAAG